MRGSDGGAVLNVQHEVFRPHVRARTHTHAHTNTLDGQNENPTAATNDSFHPELMTQKERWQWQGRKKKRKTTTDHDKRWSPAHKKTACTSVSDILHITKLLSPVITRTPSWLLKNSHHVYYSQSSAISRHFSLSSSLSLPLALCRFRRPELCGTASEGTRACVERGSRVGGGGGRGRQATRYFVGLQSEAQKPFLSVVTSQRAPRPHRVSEYITGLLTDGDFVADSNTRMNRGANLWAVGTSKWHGSLFWDPERLLGGFRVCLVFVYCIGKGSILRPFGGILGLYETIFRS